MRLIFTLEMISGTHSPITLAIRMDLLMLIPNTDTAGSDNENAANLAQAPRSLLLKEDNPDEPALFLSLRGNRMAVRSIEVMVKKYCTMINTNKRITPHKLRSTYGTALYRETGDIYLVAEVLGHKDVNTTKKHYAQMNNENKRRAANIVQLKKDRDADV